MVRLAFFTLFFTLTLQGTYLKKVYFVQGDEITLATVTQDKRNDKVLYTFERDRYLKRVRAKELLRLLHENGYRHFKSNVSYVTFIKESPLDTTPLQNRLRKRYLQRYLQMDIHDIKIIPRNRIEKLPKNYTLKLQPRSLLLSHGTFSIKTPHRQYFFDYYIDANLYVFQSKKKILKGEVLSGANLKKEYIHFERFRAMPIRRYDGMQAKHHINKGRIVTLRDVKRVDLVRRGEFVSVILKKSNMEIDMSAKALQAGGLHDIILIKNSRGKKLRAKVVGKNMVEVETLK